MTIFGLTIPRKRSLATSTRFCRDIRCQCHSVRIVRGPELLGPEELTAAFAKPLHDPLFRAVLQIIETAEDNANRQAAADPANREAYVGGAAQLRTLLDDFMNRHEVAMESAESMRTTVSAARSDK